jgi:hypothetical protein
MEVLFNDCVRVALCNWADPEGCDCQMVDGVLSLHEDLAILLMNARFPRDEKLAEMSIYKD